MPVTLDFRSPQIRRPKNIVAAVVLISSLIFCFYAIHASRASQADFGAYWSASRLLLTGQNPYDVQKVFALENNQCFYFMPLVMRNPPWLIPLILPMGLFSYKIARALWVLPQVFILIGCAVWTWRQFAPPKSPRWIAWLFIVTSIPCLQVLMMGQTTPLILLGVTGFLYCECNGRTNTWWQAVCLVLIAIKPQLLYLFWIALVFWIFDGLRSGSEHARTRSGLLMKFFVALFVASTLPLFLDIHVWTEYLEYLRRAPILLEIIPTFGNLLRLRTHLPLAQFLPMIFGGTWLIWRWMKKQKSWDWSEEIPLLVLASVLTTSYSWFYDQIIVLPAVLYALAQNFPSRDRKHFMSALLMCLAANAYVLFIAAHTKGLDDFRYLWTWPVWCLLFASLRWLASNPVTSTSHIDPVENTAERYAANLVG